VKTLNLHLYGDEDHDLSRGASATNKQRGAYQRSVGILNYFKGRS
jgi:hypothetical protein